MENAIKETNLIKIELTERESFLLTRDMLGNIITRMSRVPPEKRGNYYTEIANLCYKIINARIEWKNSKPKDME